MPKLLLVAKDPTERNDLSVLLKKYINGWEYLYTDTLGKMERLLLTDGFDMLVLSGHIASTTSRNLINNLAERYPSMSILVSCQKKSELVFGNRNQEMFIKLFVQIVDELEYFNTGRSTGKPAVPKSTWDHFLRWSDN